MEVDPLLCDGSARGLKLMALHRVALGPLLLGDLPTGLARPETRDATVVLPTLHDDCQSLKEWEYHDT